MLATRLDYQPLIFVDTSNLSREEWLACRRNGIGGSDAAAVMRISPFRTARDIYYDKLGIVSATDTEENWVALKIGHLLEDLVAEIFTRKTGLPIYQIKKMFQHPLYPFMLADVDYFIRLPNGKTAILEIKTTNYHASKHWREDGKEIVPDYYEVQGRHYMAVMNVDEVYFCCLYGNNEDEVIIRHIVRDEIYESEMIFLEQCFWEENVLAHVPPDYTEDGDLIEASLKRYSGPAERETDAMQLLGCSKSYFERYLDLQARKSEIDKVAGRLEKEMKRLRALITADMGPCCTAYCDVDGSSYKITYNPTHKTEVKKDNLLRLKALYPEAFQACATESKYRTFHVSKNKENAA